jgi:SAM-dependent methyltransferase
MKKSVISLTSLARTRLKNLTPRFVVRGIRKTQTALQQTNLRATKAVFNEAPSMPNYLGMIELQHLQTKYPLLPEYGYDARSIERRGIQRAKEILRLPGPSSLKSYLELGCWDGMVSYFLQCEGKQTTAIDIRSEGLDDRARREGVRFLQMDAEDLQLAEDSFDCVFSYDAFEHFPHPERVFQNALRVLRRHGLLFLNFGPLYMSPFGQHAYRTITFPYCQFLFPAPLLHDYAVANGLEPIDPSHVNGWPATRFRRLWEEHLSSFKSIRYTESLNLAHLDLVKSYPSCFRSKTDSFDNLIVETMTAVFEKVQ